MRSEIDDLASLFQELARSYGVETRITSTFRSRADQERLYRRRLRSSYPTAPPGRSTHEYGLAFDLVAVDRGYQPWLGELAESLGLYWGGRFGDPPHFQVVHPSTWSEWLRA